jgi:hypothetical protein
LFDRRSLPGVIGVALVGVLYDLYGDWNLALFAPSSLLMLLGTAAYTLAVTHEQIDFDNASDNAPFAFEQQVSAVLRSSPLPKVAAAAAGPLNMASDALAAASDAMQRTWVALGVQRTHLQAWVEEQRKGSFGETRVQQQQQQAELQDRGQQARYRQLVSVTPRKRVSS